MKNVKELNIVEIQSINGGGNAGDWKVCGAGAYAAAFKAFSKTKGGPMNKLIGAFGSELDYMVRMGCFG